MPYRFWLSFFLILVSLQGHALDRDDDTTSKLLQLREIAVDISKKICPKPLHVETSNVANKYDETVIDSVKTVTCPGFKVETYYAKLYNPPKPLLRSVALTDPRRTLPYDLAMGVSKATVLNILGSPDIENNDGLYYLVPDEGPCSDGISFLLVSDSVVQIVWGFCFE